MSYLKSIFGYHSRQFIWGAAVSSPDDDDVEQYGLDIVLFGQLFWLLIFLKH